MAKKQTNTHNKSTTAQRPWWLWLAAAAALLLLGGGVFLLLGDGGAGPMVGTPKVVVEQSTIDAGYQPYNQQIRTAFTLRNEGDGVLRILNEPQVELIEGC